MHAGDLAAFYSLRWSSVSIGNSATRVKTVPPTPQPGETAIVEVGRQTGTKVLWRVPGNSMGLEFYQADQFHLNPLEATPAGGKPH